MRILVVTPWVPYPITGADQQDRFEGFKQLQELGHDIHVIAKIHRFQPRHEIEIFYRDAGIQLTLVPYAPSLFRLLLQKLPSVLVEPALLDGSALEYIDSATTSIVTKKVQEFKPDVAWVEFTFLWPVVRLLKKLGVPSVMRSANNEAQQSIDEHRGSWKARMLAIPKFRGEKIAARESDMLLAITPNEEQWYQSLEAKHVDVLPLRALPHILRSHTHHQKEVLDVVFLSSSYSNGHNCDALEFLLKEILPEIHAKLPGTFHFHITGQKFPEKFRSLVSSDITVHGFIPDLRSFLDTMDIAVCPSVGGQGMQQKIFEPLCCGLPLITHHTAGYPFADGTSVLLAHDGKTYAKHLETLLNSERRQSLADEALRISSECFSHERLLATVANALHQAKE